jgi:hypothetical protein
MRQGRGFTPPAKMTARWVLTSIFLFRTKLDLVLAEDGGVPAGGGENRPIAPLKL